MSEYKSFISEHSSEYVLVPKLKRLLEQNNKYVVPIFPWSTREGNNYSINLHNNAEIRLISLFPRRPKYHKNFPNNVYFKINYELIDYVNTCKDVNDMYQIEIAQNNEFKFVSDAIFENNESLLNYLYSNSKSLSFKKAMELIKIINKERDYSTRFWGAKYKPVYFLFKGNLS